MSTFSDGMVAVAKDLLLEFGEVCNFTHTQITDFDIATQSNVVNTYNYSGKCYPGKYAIQELAENTILASDLKVLASTMTRVPMLGDTCNINSTDYRIISVERTRVSGQDVIYTIQARI